MTVKFIFLKLHEEIPVCNNLQAFCLDVHLHTHSDCRGRKSKFLESNEGFYQLLEKIIGNYSQLNSAS